MLAVLGVLGVVCALCAAHAHDVGAALAAVPLWAMACAVALHLVTLVLRSEAWRLTLAAVGGPPLSRRVVHRANAAAFVAGAVQSQAALPARVALLRRLAGERAPRTGQIFVADVPIFALELCATALLLVAGVASGFGAWWMAPVALALGFAVLLGARLLPDRFADRPVMRGLAVLADRRRRGTLVALVAAIAALTAARIFLVLAACGLPHGLGEVAWVFATLGVFGLLPIGPGAPAGATLAALGTAAVGATVAAGLLLSVSSIAAVVAYALLMTARWRPRQRRAAIAVGA